jgi:cellulose synthase (UDP-forming)
MLTVSEHFASIAPSLIVVGLALGLLPLLDRSDWRARTAVLIVSTFLAWRYMIWRFTDTIPELSLDLDALVAWAFASLEAVTVLSSTLAALILTRTRNRSREADASAGWWASQQPPKVDVYIATYNEEIEVLERTIVGAKSMSGPAARIFVLDDGRREWLRQQCGRLGVEYRQRPDNSHAKAGNINFTLMQRLRDEDAPDFVAILDADFVPHRNFIVRTLALFKEPSVGLVQTPQHFFNPDPIQHNLGISSGYPDEQRFFFDHVEPARDAWTIAICCGTSSTVRTQAVAAIGGFPTESVTEDFLLTLRLDEKGWRTVYLNEALTEGLAPEGLREYIVQRGRWCLGLMQIVRNVYPPFGSQHQLRFMHRVGLLDSLLYWSSTFSFRLAGLAVPLLYWYGGLTVVSASVTDVLRFYLPYYLAVILGLNWISRGMILPLLNDVSQLVAAWPVTRAAALGLMTKGPHKFKVTAKGGDRTRVVVQWPLLWPFALVFLLTLFGLIVGLIAPEAFNYDHIAGDGMQVIVTWTIYNLALLIIAMIACIEQPRADRPQRSVTEAAELYIAGRIFTSWVLELGVQQARIRGPAGLTAGDVGSLALATIGDVPAIIDRETTDGYYLKLSPTVEQRRRLLDKLHTTDSPPGIVHGDVRLILKQLARLLTAR